MKKFVYGLMLTGVCALCLGCENTKGSNSNQTPDGVSSENMETMALGAITSIESSSVFANSNLKVNMNLNNDYDDIEIELLKKSEALLEDEIQIETLESDREGYLYKHQVSYMDKVYDMYVKNQRVETENDDEQEIEVEYNGIVIYNDLEYRFTSEYSSEQEHDEQEEEIRYTFFYDDHSTVTINKEFEIEDNEQEEVFSYKMRTNGRVVASYKVEREVERNRDTLEIETDGINYKYNFYSENGKDYVRVIKAYQNAPVLYEITIEEIDGVSQKVYTRVTS